MNIKNEIRRIFEVFLALDEDNPNLFLLDNYKKIIENILGKGKLARDCGNEALLQIILDNLKDYIYRHKQALKCTYVLTKKGDEWVAGLRDLASIEYDEYYYDHVYFAPLGEAMKMPLEMVPHTVKKSFYTKSEINWRKIK